MRAFFVSNPVYWMEEFHIDGFRLDATHAIGDDSPRHVLEEIAGAIHERGGFCHRRGCAQRRACCSCPPKENGYGLDGVWSDDFHHAVRVFFTREAESYFEDFDGSLRQIVETLRHGWLYRGQYSKHGKENRGTECRHIPPQKFVFCTSNHDQIGNRAFGDRLVILAGSVPRRLGPALPRALYPHVFHGPGMGRRRPFPVLYGS